MRNRLYIGITWGDIMFWVTLAAFLYVMEFLFDIFFGDSPSRTDDEY